MLIKTVIQRIRYFVINIVQRKKAFLVQLFTRFQMHKFSILSFLNNFSQPISVFSINDSVVQNRKIIVFMKKGVFLLMYFAVSCVPFLKSQNLYIAGNSPNGGYLIGQYDVSTCTFCPELDLPFSLFVSNSIGDVAPLPNGQVVITADDLIFVFDPPSAVPITTLDPPGNYIYVGAVLAPNGNVYMSGVEFFSGQFVSSLFEYNPVSNTITLLGSFPVGTFVSSEIFFWNGQLYSILTDGSVSPATYALATIQIGNPLTANIIYTYTTLCGVPTATISTGPFAGIYTGAFDPNCTGSELFSFDLPNNSIAFECDIQPYGYPYGMGEVPVGFPATNCVCLTNAGSIETQPLTTYCTNTGASLIPNFDEVLDNNDLIQYVMISNLSNPVGSIIATSNTPAFAFAPPMQTGVTYYIGAVAGNNVGGNISLTDPCLDFSNFNPIVWRPLPSVSFSVANPAVCAGACTDVTANFTGIAPFNLTYTTPASGSFTQVFAGNTGVFQVCTPIGSAPGSFLVQATALIDANCICN